MYNNKLTQLPYEVIKLTKLKKNIRHDKGLSLKGNCFRVPDEILKKKEPKEILHNILSIDYQGKIIDGKFFVFIRTQRNLRKGELTQITEWLNTFEIKAFFMVQKNKPDIKLSRKSETALHEIKQYISDKRQDHISLVYSQKTQVEK